MFLKAVIKKGSAVVKRFQKYFQVLVDPWELHGILCQKTQHTVYWYITYVSFSILSHCDINKAEKYKIKLTD